MIGTDFIFRDRYLSEFGLIMANPESNDSFPEFDIDKGDISAVRSCPKHYGKHYTDVLKLNFLLIKDPCANNVQSDMVLSGEMIDSVRSWLESPSLPTKLVVFFESEPVRVNYYGTFTSVQPYLFNSECYGLSLTFTCNAPYGFSDDVVRIYSDITDEFSDIYTNYSSEEFSYLYPKIIIDATSNFDGSESISITNHSDADNLMNIKMPSGKSSITINCKEKSVVDSDGKAVPLSLLGVSPIGNGYNHLLSSDVVLFYWLRFLHGDNKLSFSTSSPDHFSKIELVTAYEIKSGGFEL